MLHELRVRQLGVVEDATLVLEAGMTAITGETGAGKTMVVEAIRLLTGGRSEPRMVRTGAAEAVIEGRFNEDENETVLSRSIARAGKSRAAVNDRMVPVATLVDAGENLVDLHGQNAHQALLTGGAPRQALDHFGHIDLGPLHDLRHRIAEIDSSLAKLGGDPQTRAREIDILRFQVEELDAANLDDPDEASQLEAEEESLADAGAHREAAALVYDALNGDGGALESLSNALKHVSGRAPLAGLDAQLRSALADVAELAHEAGGIADALRDDPQRLAEVQDRRAVIKQLLRKYGANIAEAKAYRIETSERIAELDRYEEAVAELEAQRTETMQLVAKQESLVRHGRLLAAPLLAHEVELRLRELALPNARFEIQVGATGPGDAVEFLLGPNPGMPLLPVAKAASGGELARTMLALRLSLMSSTANESAGRVLVFDEVDAGIGGEAAVAVGKALADLSHQSGNQVLVVTHLPQVAAFADHQITVQKEVADETTVAHLHVLTDDEREVELARMLSGRPDSTSGRAHARELLAQAGASAAGLASAKPTAKPSAKPSPSVNKNTGAPKAPKARTKRAAS